nr:transposase [Micromonospora pisi]
MLDYDLEIPEVICSTNAIGSLNARYRRDVKARAHCPNQAGRVEVSVPGSWTPSGAARTR